MRLKAPQNETTEDQGLLRDQAGATMVMGIFMAMLLVGLIYYVWGIGDAVMVRERMQDASDTAAFSAAVIHARGMNLISLMNMIMAALAVVGATLTVIGNMLSFATTAAAFVCAFCGPWCGSCCDACPHAVRHGLEYVEELAVDLAVGYAVEGLMEGLHAFCLGLRVGVPLSAQAKVQSYADVYAPVTENSVMLPLRPELPVEDDFDNWACDEKVAPYVYILSPTMVWLWGHSSIYMGAGIVYGISTVPTESRYYCQFGYFQRVTSDAQEMGNDEYQLQAYMLGDHDLEWTQEGVGAANWGIDEEAGARYTDIAAFGDVSFAQAEFMFDDPEDDWREWMWAMNWRARLRRWRESAAGSGGVGSALGGLSGVLGGGGMDEAVVH